MIDRVAANPTVMGKELRDRWEGARAVHFADDKHRLVWEVHHDRELVIVLLVGPKRDRHGTIYDRERPTTD
jgi:hypothetical protein